eukprot:jgi/Botrbrau1/19481/Bobra.0908s0001.1
MIKSKQTMFATWQTTELNDLHYVDKEITRYAGMCHDLNLVRGLHIKTSIIIQSVWCRHAYVEAGVQEMQAPTCSSDSVPFPVWQLPGALLI